MLIFRFLLQNSDTLFVLCSVLSKRFLLAPDKLLWSQINNQIQIDYTTGLKGSLEQVSPPFQKARPLLGPASEESSGGGREPLTCGHSGRGWPGSSWLRGACQQGHTLSGRARVEEEVAAAPVPCGGCQVPKKHSYLRSWLPVLTDWESGDKLWIMPPRFSDLQGGMGEAG